MITYTKTQIISLSVLLCGVLFAGCRDVEPPAPFGAVPSQQQVAWQQMETNLFVHFGPNTFTNAEWGDGKEDVNLFAPTQLDCRQWAATARAAGMKGIILTAKHHDGFCLWPTVQSEHSVAQSRWRDGRGDVLKELSEACREYGLKFGVYLSPWDQNHPAYGSEHYNEVFCQSLDEVLSRYGDVFEQWFDGACGEGPSGHRQVYDWARFHATVYRNQPDAIIFSDVGPGCRWIGNEGGFAGETCRSTLDTAGYAPGNSPALDTLNCGNRGGAAWVPGEVDVSIRPGWFFKDSETSKIKSVAQLMEIYYASVGRNALLLLNVPADRRGLIPARDSVRLLEFRAAIDRVFATDFAADACIEASNVRGRAKQFAAENLLDDNYDSYWATDDEVHAATLTLRLPAARTINRVMLQEYIPLGQRIDAFEIAARNADDQSWTTVADGTTIGYKRIVEFDSLQVTQVQIRITQSQAAPVLNRVGLFFDPGQPAAPVVERNKQGLVTITPQGFDEELYYTVGDSLPSMRSLRYTHPFIIRECATVNAIAASRLGESQPTSVDFDIAPTLFRVIAPQGGNAIADGLTAEGVEIPAEEPILLDLGKVLPLAGFFYVPLNDKRFGCIARFDFAVSRDGKRWTTILSDTPFNNIVNNPIRQDIRFAKTQIARYVKITPRQVGNATQSYFAAELGILTR